MARVVLFKESTTPEQGTAVSKMVIYQQYRNPGVYNRRRNNLRVLCGGVCCVKTRGLGGISPLGVASVVNTNIAMVIELRCDRMLLKGPFLRQVLHAVLHPSTIDL